MKVDIQPTIVLLSIRADQGKSKSWESVSGALSAIEDGTLSSKDYLMYTCVLTEPSLLKTLSSGCPIVLIYVPLKNLVMREHC